MKRLLGFFIAVLMYFSGAAQQILLMAQTFEDDTTGLSFVLNFGGPATNHGNNQWTVNSQYNGLPLYPNTPPEDSIANGGIIYLSPHSHYLHIHNKAAEASGIANANWDTSAASDRFCYIGSPFCTAGLTNVTFTFFWICQGDSNAYGQVYYNANGAGWVQTGQPKYYNQSEWIYESLLDTNFNNLQSLQFGFRWVNPQTTDSSDVSFGIDDVIAVGNYDSISDPTTMSVSIIPPDSICQGDAVTFTLQLAQPLCDGEYNIQMSDASGSFEQPYDLGTYGDLPGGYTIYQDLQTLGVPTNITGSCFKLRIIRLTPPVITSDTSACFVIKHCPNTVFNESVPVLTDVDTACNLSELDVYFNSTGIFGANNVYYAEISDSSGNFTDSTRLGMLQSSMAFPAMPQGDVTGLIPASVPPGCGYYVRVRSTNPPVIGPSIGPFCITHCDELTNNHTDIHLCISSGPYPQCDTLRIQPHYWGTDAQYDTCNHWIVELLDMQSLAVINDGFFGAFYDSIGGFFTICAPLNADSIAFLPMPQWSYYLRVKSTCSSESWNQTGSIIRIVIGAPQTTPLNLTASDSFVCNTNGSIISLYVSPFNYPTNTYYWSSNLLNGGNAFTWPNNPLSITLNPQVTKGTYTFYVQEANNGCFGPNSAPATVTVVGVPVDTIRGPQRVCVGDTAAYNETFLPKTHYTWSASTGVQILNNSNVQARLIFDTIGVYQISCETLNDCLLDYPAFLTVKVVAPFTIDATADTTVCAGQPVNLGVQTGEDLRVLTPDTFGTYTAAGAMFNLVARYDVIIDSFAVRYQKAGNVTAQIFGKNGSYVGFEQTSAAWSQLGQTTFQTPADIITVIPVEVNVSIAAGDSYAFYVTTNNNSFKEYLDQGNGIQQGVDYASDSVLTFQQGSQNQYAFGSSLGPYILNTQIYYSTKGGFHYTWSNGDSGQFIQIKPLQSANYSVYVFDSAACSNNANVFVTVNPGPTIYAGPDTTVCPDSNYVMQATSTTTNVYWTPAFGLSDSTLISPVFNSPDSGTYVLVATGANGCASRDSVQIAVIKVLLNLPPVGPICSDSFVTIPATTSARQVVWTPGTGLNRTDTINPIFNYSESVTYFVTATDKGCNVTDSLKVDVELCLSHLIAPKAFSPDGNGTNDHFTIFGDNIVTYQIRIFNRWGEEVYQSNDVSELNQMSKGWDGTYKGKKQDAGSFAWYITAKDVNDKNIQLKGNVILVR